MKLSEVKSILANSTTIGFQLADGSFVPNHFHVTEVGKINKHFVDCGGTIRNENVVNFQLWNANDYDHRLIVEITPQKNPHISEGLVYKERR